MTNEIDLQNGKYCLPYIVGNIETLIKDSFHDPCSKLWFAMLSLYKVLFSLELEYENLKIQKGDPAM